MPLPDHIGYADLYEVAPTSAIDRSLVRPLNQWMQSVMELETAVQGGVLVSAIDPPTPDPTIDGTLWYDPSTGTVSAWYGGAWVASGTPAPSSPTPLVGQSMTVTVGGVATLIKRLDLPVPYFDGGNSYYQQFPKAAACGWGSPTFFPFAVHLSPAQPPYGANTAAAGMTHYHATEDNTGNIEYALAEGLGVNPYMVEWSLDRVDSEDGDSNPLVNGWNIGDELEMGDAGGLAELNRRLAIVSTYNDGRYTGTNIGNGVLGYVGFTDVANPGQVDDIVRAVDVASVDQYFYSSEDVRYNAVHSPYWTGGPDPEDARRSASYGWLCDRMRGFQDPDSPRPYGVFLETACPFVKLNIDVGAGEAFFPGSGLYLHPEVVHITLPQISGAAWSSIRHGARLINFFQHNNNGRNNVYSLAADEETVIRGQVTALTSEITALAPALDGPTYEWDFGDANIETCLKTLDDDAYIFAGVALLAPLPGVGESDIEQTGTTLQFQFTDASETGTVSSAITVPDDAELVVVAVSGLHGTNNGFAAMTFTKGGVDTAMVKATGGDISGASWQAAIFTLDMPDTGASKTLKWDWLGAASSGPRVVAVTFWRGIDLSEPIRDSDGVQDTSFALETPTLVETPTIAAADGDKLLAFCGMYNAAADGAAQVNVWHHAARLEELTHQSVAEGGLATGTPDGDCTVGFENISAASEAALVAVTMKGATLEEVTSTIEYIGVHTTSAITQANTGTFFLPATVPADCTFVLAGVSGDSGFANPFAALTMPKGGVDTPMIRLPGGDESTEIWQGALFYMVNPDVGASKDVKWDWTGSSTTETQMQLSLTFWKGVDTTTPVRDSNAVQIDDGDFPGESPMLTNREGDRVVTYFGGYCPAGEGSVDTWKNLTTLEQLTHQSFHDGAWGTATVIGSLKVGVTTVTGFQEGSLCAVVLRPSAAVTPITPAADPPTTPRTVVTGTFTLPPDLAAATTVEVLNESRTIPIAAGVFTDDFDEEWSYHNYRIAIP